VHHLAWLRRHNTADAGGVQVGNDVRLLGGVPKNIIVFILAWVSHEAAALCPS
jgi:hypothetical protein